MRYRDQARRIRRFQIPITESGVTTTLTSRQLGMYLPIFGVRS